MQHTELQAPAALSEWQAFLRAADSQVTFQDYRTLFEGPAPFTITDELRQIVEDFGPASREAVYALLGKEIYAVWIDPFHNYVAIVCTKAGGDPEDATLIMCYSKADAELPRESPGSEAASGEPNPVRDDGSELADNVMTWEECVWKRIPMPDLSDMDRVHAVAAGDQLSDIFVRLASRAPK
jgi:hypothetical protein